MAGFKFPKCSFSDEEKLVLLRILDETTGADGKKLPRKDGTRGYERKPAGWGEEYWVVLRKLYKLKNQTYIRAQKKALGAAGASANPPRRRGRAEKGAKKGRKAKAGNVAVVGAGGAEQAQAPIPQGGLADALPQGVNGGAEMGVGQGLGPVDGAEQVQAPIPQGGLANALPQGVNGGAEMGVGQSVGPVVGGGAEQMQTSFPQDGFVDALPYGENGAFGMGDLEMGGLGMGMGMGQELAPQPMQPPQTVAPRDLHSNGGRDGWVELSPAELAWLFPGDGMDGGAGMNGGGEMASSYPAQMSQQQQLPYFIPQGESVASAPAAAMGGMEMVQPGGMGMGGQNAQPTPPFISQPATLSSGTGGVGVAAVDGEIAGENVFNSFLDYDEGMGLDDAWKEFES